MRVLNQSERISASRPRHLSAKFSLWLSKHEIDKQIYILNEERSLSMALPLNTYEKNNIHINVNLLRGIVCTAIVWGKASAVYPQG